MSNNTVRYFGQNVNLPDISQRQWELIPNSRGGYAIKARGTTRYLSWLAGDTFGTVSISSQSSALVDGRVLWLLEPGANNSNIINSTRDRLSPPISSSGTLRGNCPNNGIDITSSGVGKGIYAADSGLAVYVQQIGRLSSNNQLAFFGFGNFVALREDNSTLSPKRVSIYAHLANFFGFNGQNIIHNVGHPPQQTTNQQNIIAGRQTVPRGWRLGLSGTTGQSTGVHLHFESRTGWTFPSNIVDGGTNFSVDGTRISVSQLDSNYKIVGE